MKTSTSIYSKLQFSFRDAFLRALKNATRGAHRFRRMSKVRLTMKMRTLLDESAVKSALDVLGIEVESFDYPKWATMTIYTARVASWGLY